MGLALFLISMTSSCFRALDGYPFFLSLNWQVKKPPCVYIIGITMRHKLGIFGKLILPFLATGMLSACAGTETRQPLYIAWSDRQDSYSFVSTVKTVESMGFKPVVLNMVQSADLTYTAEKKLEDAVDGHGILLSEYAQLVKQNTWKGSNVEEVMKNVDRVIFPGGTDICPTLYKEEQPWHGIEADTDYSAERDVSDYLLMSYCLEKDIPLFAICRGMQMLSVVSGATMIQDIPTFLEDQGIEDTGVHRDLAKKVFVPHDVTVTDTSSLLYKCIGKSVIKSVPSWHHQGVLSVKGTKLSVTGETTTGDIMLIEAVERKDLTFCLGVQFHPEVAVRKYVDNEIDAERFMDRSTALSFFISLVRARKA